MNKSSFKKMYLKMSSGKCRPFGLGPSVLYPHIEHIAKTGARHARKFALPMVGCGWSMWAQWNHPSLEVRLLLSVETCSVIEKTASESYFVFQKQQLVINIVWIGSILCEMHFVIFMIMEMWRHIIYRYQCSTQTVRGSNHTVLNCQILNETHHDLSFKT